MGFVKGMVAGVLGVAGIFVTAAVVSVVKDEKKQHPVFFVSESSDLKNNKIKHKNFNIVLGD